MVLYPYTDASAYSHMYTCSVRELRSVRSCVFSFYFFLFHSWHAQLNKLNAPCRVRHCCCRRLRCHRRSHRTITACSAPLRPMPPSIVQSFCHDASRIQPTINTFFIDPFLFFFLTLPWPLTIPDNYIENQEQEKIKKKKQLKTCIFLYFSTWLSPSRNPSCVHYDHLFIFISYVLVYRCFVVVPTIYISLFCSAVCKYVSSVYVCIVVVVTRCFFFPHSGDRLVIICFSSNRSSPIGQNSQLNKTLRPSY